MIWKSRKLIFLIIIHGMISSMMQACQLFSVDYENRINIGEGYLTFNKDTILQDLSQGETTVFLPLATTPESNWYKISKPVRWRQADYYRIASVIFEKVWEESLDGWNLDEMDFKLDCPNMENGLQFGSFRFFKVNRSNNPPSRIERGIIIDPLTEEILWEEAEYTPSLHYKHMIDLSKIKIPAEVALQSAEDYGGQEVRLSVENMCYVYLQLVPGSRYDGWQVGYTGYSEQFSSRELFFMVVDPYTGKYKIIK